MKRRVSKRRVKIIIAKELAYISSAFQFEPLDDLARYNINHYMGEVRDYWATAAYMRAFH